MPERVVDRDEVIATLKDVVKGKEDYIYNPDGTRLCAYFDGDEPSCIAGHVFHRLGVPRQVFDQTLKDDAFGSESLNILGVYALPKYLPFEVTGDALEILSLAQSTQDQGHSWGVALERVLGTE